jgi:hypothetical protein
MKVVYVQNKSPHNILKNMTPKEYFTRVKPEVGHFRIFGCQVYIHVPKEKRTNIDPSQEERVHFWGIVNLRRHTGSTSLVKDKSRLAEMSPLRKR